MAPSSLSRCGFVAFVIALFSGCSSERDAPSDSVDGGLDTSTDQGQALISGNLTTAFEGNEFASMYGVATTATSGMTTVIIGEGAIRCGYKGGGAPYVELQLSNAEVGSSPSPFIRFYYQGEFRGSPGGSVEIIDADAQSLSLSIEYDNSSVGIASGAVSVHRCTAEE